MRPARSAILVALALALAACASTPEVRSLAAPGINLAQYRTFGFSDPLGTDRQGYQTLVSAQLKTSTRRELEARGFRFVESNPDLLVNFGARLDDKLRVSTYPEPAWGGYYGWRRGFYDPWPLYTERTDVRQVTEGTLTVDLIDAARKQLVWEGTVTRQVRSSDDLSRSLDEAVKAAFAKLPLGAAR